jgi:hypothetical protein
MDKPSALPVLDSHSMATRYKAEGFVISMLLSDLSQDQVGQYFDSEQQRWEMGSNAWRMGPSVLSIKRGTIISLDTMIVGEFEWEEWAKPKDNNML